MRAVVPQDPSPAVTEKIPIYNKGVLASGARSFKSTDYYKHDGSTTATAKFQVPNIAGDSTTEPRDTPKEQSPEDDNNYHASPDDSAYTHASGKFSRLIEEGLEEGRFPAEESLTGAGAGCATKR